MTSADFVKPTLPPIARLKRSGGPRTTAGKVAAARNGGARGIRQVMDLMPMSLSQDPEVMYQSLLATYQPQGAIALQAVKALSHCLVELDRYQQYRAQILQGQARQRIPFEDLEAVLAQSMASAELDTVRQHQDQVDQVGAWDEAQAAWATQILLECTNFRRVLNWWAGCSQERIAAQRFPLICQQLIQRAPGDPSPLSTYYGLGMACAHLPRLYDAIDQIWAEAGCIQSLWPHRALILQAQTMIRARMSMDDALLHKLDGAIQMRQSQLRRLERDLKRYGCAPVAPPHEA